MLIDLLANMAKLDNDKCCERIKQLLNAGNMRKQEIANALDIGVTTVYRVQVQGN